MPFLSGLFKETPPRKMESVHPTVSPVAWASYLTGSHPIAHGIHGFLERDLKRWEVFIPDARALLRETLWQILSCNTYTVFAMNVPMSYPPKPLRGILVGDFLGLDLDRIAFPPRISETLKSLDYMIDADTTSAARGDFAVFIDHLHHVVQRRRSAFLKLHTTLNWRLAHLHIMETDRLFHFLWDALVTDHPFSDAVFGLLRRIDDVIHEISGVLHPDDTLILMSDHGFCGIRSEIQMNAILEELGYLKWKSGTGTGLNRIDPASRAYSLIPGRVYLNMKGREPQGCVDSRHYSGMLSELSDALRQFRIDPDETAVLSDVRITAGAEIAPHPTAPDLIAIPRNGFDLKGKLEPSPMVSHSNLRGMHTFDDAFLWISNRKILKDAISIRDLFPSILNFFGIHDIESDGQVIF